MTSSIFKIALIGAAACIASATSFPTASPDVVPAPTPAGCTGSALECYEGPAWLRGLLGSTDPEDQAANPENANDTSAAELNALVNIFFLICCCSPAIGFGIFVICSPTFGATLLIRGVVGKVAKENGSVTDISIIGTGPFMCIKSLKLPMLYVSKIFVVIAIVVDFVIIRGAGFIVLAVMATKTVTDPIASAGQKNWIIFGVVTILSPFVLQLLTGFGLITMGVTIFMLCAWLHAIVSLIRTLLPQFSDDFAKYFGEAAVGTLAQKDANSEETPVAADGDIELATGRAAE